MISPKAWLWIPVVVLLGCWASAAGQELPQGDPMEPLAAEETRQDNVPGVGEILEFIDKASGGPIPGEDAEEQTQEGWTAPVRLAIVFAFLALLPSLLVLTTAFTRIVIVLGFVRRALSTQNIPPTVAVIGLALFLTLFTMAPVFEKINTQAIEPYMGNEMTFPEAVEAGNVQLKDFMLRQTRQRDLELFLGMARLAPPETQADVPMRVAIPAFAISEFRTAFEIGCLLFVPFLLIDLVVGGILLSAGMMMLPPAMVSLPFKIILFVLVDGWRLLAETLVLSFG